MNYSIEELHKTFLIHAEQSKKSNEKLLSDFIENNPGRPIPEHFLDDFSIPLALATICQAILDLKKPNN